MKKKKILFLLEAVDKGGIEKVTLDIVNHLDPEKYDITVQTFWYGGHCQSLVHDNIHVIPFFFKRYVRGIIRLIEYLPPRLLYRLFVHGDYDVEIAASDGGAAKVISGSTNKRAKKICWVHMDVVNRGSKLKEFRNAETAKKIYEKFDVIVPVSEACKDSFIQKFGTEYPIEVKRNPMPVEEIRRKSEEFIPEKMDAELKIVCIGRLVEQKGFDRLIRVCNSVVRKGGADVFTPQFHIYIIGEGSDRDKLQQMIHEYHLQNYITLMGFRENPYPYLKAADVFLLTSRDEAFSLVVGESLIVGTPVVATACCGVSEWLEDGKYGMILENSTEGILAGLRKILEHPERMKEYRNRILEAQKKISFIEGLTNFEQILY